MKKLNISHYAMRTKWIVLVVVSVALAVFGRLIEVPSLNKSSIVLGVGIDYIKGENLFEVSVQSVLVGASSGDTSQTTYNNYTGTGKTVAGALDDISRKMGLIVSLSHCNVLFMSQEAMKLDHFQLIYPLVVMYEMPEHAIIVTGNKSPKEMLAIRIGTTVSAPFFLQSTLYNQEGSNGMIKTTAKDMLARSLSRSKTAVVPYISAKKLEDQPMTGQDTLKDNYEFDMSRSLAFNHDSCIVIEERMAEMLALYYSQDVAGVLNYTAENGETVEYKILKKDVKLKADGMSVFLDMSITVDFLDVQNVDENEVMTSAEELIKKMASMMANKMRDTFIEMYNLSKDIGIDFLSLQAKAYQSVGRDMPNDCLDDISFYCKIDISVEEAA